MPRYSYKCIECDESFDVVHGIFDECAECVYCSSNKIKRVPQILYVRRESPSNGEKVGEATKRAIEENRKLLNEEKKIRVEYKDGD